MPPEQENANNVEKSPKKKITSTTTTTTTIAKEIPLGQCRINIMPEINTE